ncbi:LPS-assembly protein LptD [Patescibacteria group bacterium]|nr:LPS-assembly protein LptD [Patescibacteria group bacterium]
MHRRLPLVFLPLLYAPLCFANDAAWNCEQNKDTKEWLCVGDEKPAATSEPASSFPSSTPERVERDDEFSSPAPKTARVPEPAIKREEEPVFATQPEPEFKTAEPETTPVEKPASVAVEKTEASEEPTKESKRTKKLAELLPEEPVKVTKTEDAPVLDKEEKVAAKSSEEEDENAEEMDDEDAEKPKKITSAAKTTRMTGWNCGTKSDDWNCQLVGADPKGKAHPVRVAKEDTSWHLLDPAFDLEQEQNFEALADRFNYDPWDESLTKQQREKLASTKKADRETAPIELTSDFAEIFDNEISSYLGNVDISRADQHSLSHIANYDKISQVLDLNGDVYYNEDQLALYGQSASLRLDDDQAKLRNALFVSPATHLRGSSKVVYRDSKTFSRYKDVSYTSCRPGNQDWVLHADELKLNDVTGRGAVKDAWLEFKGLPVFYTPYM